MARFSMDSLMIALLATISAVLGCGVMPASQASTRMFTVTGFRTLPVAMVYTSSTTVSSRVVGIATSEAGAKGFVQLLVMQAVFGVLEHEGRSALLPDAVISTILSQLSVSITYEPLLCHTVVLSLGEMFAEMMPPNCIIVSNAVTGICTKKPQNGAGQTKCDMPTDIAAIPDAHLKISGTLMTTNIIMANWSRTKWQGVVNRAVRMLASGPYGSYFVSSTATVSGS
ncbi:hypothetical protein KIN20_026265 [Parelaphostrongylus tenuis]|uniref:Uncharacterized protein n=1 Tax=Parelaphostrongylus tenuis TaxID=148309 RepID=A0AAD5MWG8_PARTN|nr:hypothetical protein KIN20_026265 [Parelaphostrongylus tenuis]